MTATRTPTQQISLADQLAGIHPDTGAVQVIQLWTGFARGRSAVVATTITPDGTRSTKVVRQGGPKHVKTAFGRCSLGTGFVFADEAALHEQVTKLNADLGPCTACGVQLPAAGKWCTSCGTPQMHID